MDKIYIVPEYMKKKHLKDYPLSEIPPNIAWKWTATSTSGLAKALGCINFDTALPRSWVKDFKKLTGFNPVLNFVWSYDCESHFGYPVPITLEAKVAYKIYKHLTRQEK